MDSKAFTQEPIRLLGLLIAIGLCAWTINSTARLGLSRMFMKYSLLTGNAMAANMAIEMSPKDAEAHRARAAVLSLSKSPAESAVEMERAVALRAADYSLWLDLGLIRDQMGDTSGALAAFDEAVKRAPFYAMPRWQRGNLLLRLGQYEAAFKDLNQAAHSNPELIPNFVDLAWNLSNGDPKVVREMVQVDSRAAHKVMARYFASHGKPQEALVEFQATGTTDELTRRDLINKLLAKGSFAEAYQVWSATKGLGDSDEQSSRQIFDGGFESTLSFDEGGFNWRIPRNLQAATVSSDSSQPHTGSKNLRIEFAGDSNPGTELVSQLLLVEPSRRYRINFSARSQEVVSGGLPVVTVTDAGATRKRLGQSQALSKGSGDWKVFSCEFATQPDTNGVVVSVQREGCSSAPCPIFGVISLDSFSIEQLK
ncbi:MAG: tetratricopeptide repeat protein [Pyrinomonadaceae bacterium]